MMTKIYMSAFVYDKELIIARVDQDPDEAKEFIEKHDIYKKGGKGYIIAGLEVLRPLPVSPIIKP